jgi:D-psicose/D-tagatose/L-ribulose 3-epimerase
LFKYAICNETFQGWTWGAACDETARCGYQAIEIAPFTLAPDVREIDSQQRKQIVRTAQAIGLEITGLHWLLVSPKGLSITGDNPAVRAETSEYIKALVEFCADVQGKTMVLGSPAQRRLPDAAGDGTSSTDIAESRLLAVLVPALQRAEELGVVICLEPLPAPEADFILTLREAMEIVNAVEHPALKTMLDIKSACSDELPIPELIERYSASIKHVHVNDANRRGPGFGDTDYVPILAALHRAGYDGPVSVEVFDYTPDPITIAKGSIEYLRRCEPCLQSGG